MRKRYSDEFKARAVDLYNKGGITYDELAADLGISRAAISVWIRQSKEGASPPADETEKAELKRLRKEVELLREEREILKKAATFFARESTPRR
jgi:Transposase and inactivated derivatives